MPRRLENDRWLFIVTLGLCLLGAVMQDSIGFLLKNARPGDAILTVGAGSVSRASNELMVLLGTEHPSHHAPESHAH